MPASSGRWPRRYAARPKKPRRFDRRMAKAMIHLEVKTAFDVFGSELPDETFAGVFEQPRQGDRREVGL
jgi:hypothetical protein